MTVVCIAKDAAHRGVSYSVALIYLRQEGSADLWAYEISFGDRGEHGHADRIISNCLFDDPGVAERDACRVAQHLIKHRKRVRSSNYLRLIA